MSQLVVDQLAVRFGRIKALESVSFAVADGERLAIIGPNGAGKSTVVRTIAGLNHVTDGEIRFEGEPLINRRDADAAQRGIVLVPQGRRLFTHLSVRENLELGAYLIRDRKQIASDIARWVELIPEIRDKLDDRAGSLSGGQQQIVAVVRGLMARPRLLMLDEPSMGVAPAVIHRVGELMNELNRDLGLTLVTVEQNLELAFAVADRVLVLVSGRDVHCGPPDDLADQRVLTQYYFGDVVDSTTMPVPEAQER